MALTEYKDFLKDDGSFEKIIEKAEKMRVDFESKITAMKQVVKGLQAELRNSLSAPKIDTGTVSRASDEVRELKEEIRRLKEGQKKASEVKRKFIELSRQEQEEIIRDKEATRQLRLELSRLERERINQVGTLKRLRAEIALDEDALERLNLETKEGRKQARLFSKEIDKKRAAIKKAEFAIGKYSSNVGNYPKLAMAAASATQALISAFGLYQGLQIARSIFEEIKAINSLNASLKAVTKTTAEYNASQLFLLDISQRYGLELNTTTKAYTKFFASLKGSGVSIQQGKAIFDSVTKSTALLGLTTEEAEGALTALSQILSKGKVQAEELRGQLGDRLAGSMQIMAAATGKTTAELDDMLKKGQIIASEVLPQFAKQLEIAYGADKIKNIETLTARQNKLNNSWKILIRSIDQGNGVISRFAKSFFSTITGMVDRLTTLNESTGVFNKIFDNNFFDNAAKAGKEVSGKTLTSIHTAINTINSSLERMQRISTNEGGIETITKELSKYEGIVSRISAIPEEERTLFDSAELKVYSFQIERLNKLLKDVGENSKIIVEEEEKVIKAGKIREAQKEKELFRAAKLNELKAKQIELEKEQQDGLRGFLARTEDSIEDIQKKALESANRSAIAGNEILDILALQDRERMLEDGKNAFFSLVEAVDEFQQRAHERQLRRLDIEVAHRNRAVDEQRERARLNLENTLQFEERELAKAEARKERLAKRQERREAKQLFFNTLNSLIESGERPFSATAKAATLVLSASDFAASFEQGGVTGEVLDANKKGGYSRYGSITDGYIRGVSHQHPLGGIPVLVKGKEGILNEQAMENGFESPSHFNRFHNFLQSGGKLNDFVNSAKREIRVVEKKPSIDPVLGKLEEINKGINNFEGLKISGDLLGQIATIAQEQKKQGQIIQTIITGGHTTTLSNGRGLNG